MANHRCLEKDSSHCVLEILPLKFFVCGVGSNDESLQRLGDALYSPKGTIMMEQLINMKWQYIFENIKGLEGPAKNQLWIAHQ